MSDGVRTKFDDTKRLVTVFVSSIRLCATSNFDDFVFLVSILIGV